MVSSPGNTVNDSQPQLMSGSDVATVQTTLASNLLTVAHNTSRQDGCLRVVFSEMAFLPWDNPDSIVSVEVESITRRTKDIFLALLSLIGGPGNVINMAVFYKQGLKDRVNLCLFALAFADELHVVACLLMHGEQLRLMFTTGERYGPTFTFLANHHFTVLLCSRYISAVLSAMIASERCCCVLRPLHYHTMMRTRTMAAGIIAVYVVVPSLYAVVAFQYRIGCLYDPSTGAVVRTGVMGAFYKAHQQLVDFLGAFFIIGLISLVTVVVTVMTIITSVKLRGVVTWRSGTSASVSSRDMVSLTKMLVGSSVLFIACVFPTCVPLLLWQLFPEMNAGQRNQNFYLTTMWISQVFGFVNSCVNIVVYYSMGSRYRETFWALFGRTLSTEQTKA